MEKRPFTELGLSPETLKAVARVGYEVASPIQSRAIPVLLEGRDVVGQSQTGSGKTAAFALPAIERVDPARRTPQVLILCPTRELALQVAEEVARLAQFKRGVRELPIYGGASYERQFQGLRSGAQIIIGTPGRILDHMERGSLSLNDVAMVVLDEADRMLDMGFRDDLERILSGARPDRQTVLFSATLPPAIRSLVATYTRDPEHIALAQEKVTAPDIEQVWYEVPRRFKLEALCRIIDLQDLNYGIIFCATKMMVDELTDHLVARGYPADKLHGDIAQRARERVVRRLKDRQLAFLVATDVAARGLDVDDLQVVVNYDIPHDAEDYVHRIGRTGRAGRSGRAITLADGREVWKLQQISRISNSRIRREAVPSAEQVEQRRSDALIEKVQTVLAEGKYTRQEQLVDRWMDAGHTPTDIASALLSLLEAEGARPAPTAAPAAEEAPPRAGGRAEPPPARGGRERRGYLPDRHGPTARIPLVSHEEGMIRLALNAGEDRAVRPGDVVGFILNQTALPREALGAIHVLPRKTLFDIREEFAGELIEAFNGKTFRGQKLRLAPAVEAGAEESD